MSTQIKNVTFSLPVEVIDKLKIYAESNDISSMNAGVREALEEYIERLDKKRLYREMLQASQDPLFMQDLKESMRDFVFADAESVKGAQEW